jgi:hypothetical protein
MRNFIEFEGPRGSAFLEREQPLSPLECVEHVEHCLVFEPGGGSLTEEQWQFIFDICREMVDMNFQIEQLDAKISSLLSLQASQATNDPEHVQSATLMPSFLGNDLHRVS